MEVNSDLRRSARLQQNGYYNADGRPYINYYEPPYRAPKRRGQRSDTAPPAGTAPPARHGFLRRHLYTLLLCICVVGCIFSMQSCADASPFPLTGEPLKMKSGSLPSQDFTILGSRSSDTYALMGYIEKMLNWMNPKHAWIYQKWQNLVPGSCWPFQGSVGQLHVRLDKPTHISHVTVGHITKALSPTGENLSAPRVFSVYGVESSDNNETLLGRFEYDASGEAFQTFPVDPAVQKAFKDVRLNVESNWGNSEYTCLYNFRVHETPVQP